MSVNVKGEVLSTKAGQKICSQELTDAFKRLGYQFDHEALAGDQPVYKKPVTQEEGVKTIEHTTVRL